MDKSKLYVIFARNNTNSKFVIISKDIVDKLMVDINTEIKYDAHKMLKTEDDIIKMIESGDLFYTINYDVNNDDITYTKVVVVVDKNNHIKSIPNNTTIDNISNLPII